MAPGRDRRRPATQLVATALATILLLGGAASIPDSPSSDDVERPEGFAEWVTGGAGGEAYVVTTLADSGEGSLRAGAEAPGPRVITFDVDGEIRLGRPIRVASDVTVDGVGADITISNAGLDLQGVRNVIVRDLAFTAIRGSTTDAITVRDGTAGVWIHHCAFSDGQDGLVDIVSGATDVTVSWSRFSAHDKTMLIGNQAVGDAPQRATIHHNLFVGTNARNPRVKDSLVHAYNNVLRDWTGHGMWARDNAELLSEGNVFQAGPNAEGIRTAEGVGARVRSEGDLLEGGATVAEAEPNLVFDARLLYEVVVEPASPGLVGRVGALAGPRREAPALPDGAGDPSTAAVAARPAVQPPSGSPPPTPPPVAGAGSLPPPADVVASDVAPSDAKGVLAFVDLSDRSTVVAASGIAVILVTLVLLLLTGLLQRVTRRFDGWGR